MMERLKVNLKDFSKDQQKIFSGREYGIAVRDKVKLDEFDQSTELEIFFIIPEYVVSLNSSFFLGLFGRSIRNLGIGEFERRFEFDCEPHIRKNIEAGKRRALLTSNVIDEYL